MVAKARQELAFVAIAHAARRLICDQMATARSRETSPSTKDSLRRRPADPIESRRFRRFSPKGRWRRSVNLVHARRSGRRSDRPAGHRCVTCAPGLRMVDSGSQEKNAVPALDGRATASMSAVDLEIPCPSGKLTRPSSSWAGDVLRTQARRRPRLFRAIYKDPSEFIEPTSGAQAHKMLAGPGLIR